MLNKVEGHILENWENYNIPLRKPDKLYFLLSKKYAKLRFSVFRENDRKPFLFIKTTRFAKDNHIIKEEFEHFLNFKTLVGNRGNFLIPTTLDCINVDEHIISITNFIEGKKLNTKLSYFPDNLRFVTKQVISLGEITKRNTDSFAQENNLLVNMIREEVDSFFASCKFPPSEMYRLKGEIEEIIDYDDLAGKLKVAVLEHVDYGINNFIVTDERKFYLSDWEFSKGYGVPLYDLLFFVFHYFWNYQAAYARKYASEIDKHGILTYCFFEKNAHSDLILEQIYKYCKVLEVDPKLYPRILLYIFIRLENYCRKKLWADPNGACTMLVNRLIDNYDRFRF